MCQRGAHLELALQVCHAQAAALPAFAALCRSAAPLELLQLRHHVSLLLARGALDLLELQPSRSVLLARRPELHLPAGTRPCARRQQRRARASRAW